MSKNIRPDLLGIRLTRYADLEKIVRGFARGDLNLLILLGGHGLGKSRALRQAMAGQACWLEGNASAFGLYCQLWRHRNRPVVLDDLDGLYANRDGIRLLKSLTQTEPHKTVSWYTDAATLQREQIPQEFRTSSRLAIITNEWKTLNRNVAALQDRGHVVIFEPTPQEVHTRTAEWFWDQEIYDFVGERLHLLQEASMRHYVATWELKQAGLDWRSLVLSRVRGQRRRLACDLFPSLQDATRSVAQCAEHSVEVPSPATRDVRSRHPAHSSQVARQPRQQLAAFRQKEPQSESLVLFRLRLPRPLIQPAQSVDQALARSSLHSGVQLLPHNCLDLFSDTR